MKSELINLPRERTNREIELQILENSAITRVSIIVSTGDVKQYENRVSPLRGANLNADWLYPRK